MSQTACFQPRRSRRNGRALARRAGRHLCLLLAAWLAGAAVTAQARVVISEVMAANAGSFRDEDGDSPDWLELHAEGASPVDLGGWHLTDDPADLAKWTFPDTVLAPDGYLVVFASGKDRARAGRELHTNFQLGVKGEFLALVRPDGETIEYAFDPAYPALRANVSFGQSREVSETLLVSADTPVRYHVPQAGDAGTAWAAVDFDDGAWASGLQPVGYDTTGNGGGETVVLRLDFNDDDAGESGAANTEAGFQTTTLGDLPATIAGVTVALEPLGGATLDDRDRDTPADAPPDFTEDQLYDDFIFANGTFDGAGARLRLSGLAPDTEYRLTLWSFDTGSRNPRQSDWIETAGAEPQPVIAGYTFDGNRPPTRNGDDTFSVTLRSSAEGVLQLEGRRRGGTSHGVFLNALELARVGSGYGGVIRTDLQTVMPGRNASIYLRIPFELAGPALPETLLLRTRYDDGWAAWLNGRPLARRNAPETPVWDSAATAPRDDSAALLPEAIPLSGAALLRPGRNVLAVQALNVAADDDDLLFGLELVGRTERSRADRFFQPATPGAPNAAGYAGLVADTVFSADRGFYDSPFEVAITCATPGAEIRWTTDGSAPTANTGTVYTGPVPVAGTTTLRAAAFLPGLLPSNVDTQTYLFLDQVLTQAATQPGYPDTWQADFPADYGMDPEVVNDPRYGAELRADLRAIPTLSLVSDHDGLWGAQRGIYRDATRSGRAWERPASVELIAPDGQTRFQVDAGLRMQGNASRDNVRTPKHSFRLVFRGDYGPGKLHYRWFPDSPVAEFDNIVLRACFTDAWTTRYSPGANRGVRYRPEDSLYLRDIWMKDSQLAMGGHSAHNSFVHLYLNGLYWGLYNVCERLDASHFAQHFGGRVEDWDVIRDFNELLDGRRDDWDALMDLVNAGVRSAADYQAIRDRVDVTNLIDYMILHIYGEAEDWPHHNWYAAHRRAAPGWPATKWIFVVWDQEIVADRQVRRNRVNVNNDNSPARIYSQLREWPEFRREFGDRLQKHLFHHGALTAAAASERLAARAGQIRQAMVGESARWGDAREFPIPPNPGTGRTFTRDEWWEPELQKLETEWFPGQARLTLQRFRAAQLYPELEAPDFAPFGGPVPAGFELTLSNPNPKGVVLYTLNGSDPRVADSGEVAPEARPYNGPLPLAETTTVRARVHSGTAWSALVEATFYPPQDFTSLVLSEIAYHPLVEAGQDEATGEFLELHNRGDLPMNLTGLRFIEGIEAVFPDHTVLPPGGRVVMAANPAALAERFPAAAGAPAFSGRLANGGERLTLATPDGRPVWSVRYDDNPPWPPAADGLGFSLQRAPGSDDPNDPLGWLAAPPSPGEPAGGPDSDGDGMPDAWERAQGLDPSDPTDTGRDPDGDGAPNRDEYLAGTDPHDPDSCFRVRLTPLGPAVWAAGFHAEPAITYTVESRASATTGPWLTEFRLPAAVEGRDIQHPFSATADHARFYRLRALRP